MNRIRECVSAIAHRLDPRTTPRMMVPLLLLLTVTVGLAAGRVTAALGNDDRLVIGNTSGTLSAVLQVHGTRIAIGGGNSYADLTDFVDRSTLPWKRRIALLVVPGWDSRHAAGALGLVERGPVDGIAVVGSRGSAPEWGIMEEAAHRSGVRVRYLAGEHRLTIVDGVTLTFEAAVADGHADPGAATMTLNYHGAKIVFVDATTSNEKVWRQVKDGADTTPILVALRSPAALSGQGTKVAIRPVARHSSELADMGADFTGDLVAGSRLTIRLRPGEVRIPAMRLSKASTPDPMLTETLPRPTRSTGDQPAQENGQGRRRLLREEAPALDAKPFVAIEIGVAVLTRDVPFGTLAGVRIAVRGR